METPDKQTNDQPDFLKVQEAYLNGKMKRYSLLFSVNGGAFALAQLLKVENDLVLGSLKLEHVYFLDL